MKATLYSYLPSKESQLAAFLQAAMDKGQLAQADARLRAIQFLALVTAETDMRIFQRDPAPLEPEIIRQMVSRAVEMFLRGGLR